ncbi:MAG: hypothetical protein AAB599_01760 [Patescibacteria group bacterium]
MNQRGIIHLLPLLLVVAVGAYFVLQGKVKLPSSLTQLTQKKPEVGLQTTYQNPFDKDSQYVNPFSQYKNPFNNLK